MALLSSELSTLVQRTGSNTGKLRTEAERAAFSANVRADLANIIYQMNTVYKVLVEQLSSTVSLNALDTGITGDVIFTQGDADEGAASAYYDSINLRPRSIKETVDVILTEVSRIENAVDQLADDYTYDDTALTALITTNDNDLDQNTIDTFGTNYTLDNDGAADLTYSLAQHIDTLGALFTGYTATGLGYAGAMPAISGLDQSGVADLSTDLTAMRDFMGATDASDNAPTYSAHGTIEIVSDSDNLELSVQKLDEAVSAQCGSTILHPRMWEKKAADPGPSVVTYEYSDMVIPGLAFDFTLSEVAYIAVPVPVLGDGTTPSKVKFVSTFALGPAGGFGTGTGYAFSLITSNASGIGAIVDGGDITQAYQAGETITRTGLSAGTATDVYLVEEWATLDLATTAAGIINVKLRRITSNPSDNYAQDVFMVNTIANWYR